jgi:hypothetical protein
MHQYLRKSKRCEQRKSAMLGQQVVEVVLVVVEAGVVAVEGAESKYTKC